MEMNETAVKVNEFQVPPIGWVTLLEGVGKKRFKEKDAGSFLPKDGNVIIRTSRESIIAPKFLKDRLSIRRAALLSTANGTVSFLESDEDGRYARWRIVDSDVGKVIPRNCAYVLVVPFIDNGGSPHYAALGFDKLPPLRTLSKQLSDETKTISSDRAIKSAFSSIIDACVETGYHRPHDELEDCRRKILEEEMSTCSLRYQPVVHIDRQRKTFSVSHWEGLIRYAPWPGISQVAYAKWAIESARLWGSEMCSSLDKKVLEKAVAAITGNLTISINVHWASFKDESFGTDVVDLLNERGIRHNKLVIELSEEGVPPPEWFRERRDRFPGVGYALDDYPMGRFTEFVVLSLANLQMLKVDGKVAPRHLVWVVVAGISDGDDGATRISERSASPIPLNTIGDGQEGRQTE